MLIRCTKGFNDLDAGKWRSIGEEWEADASRLAEINAAGYGAMAEEVRETAPEPPETAQEPRKAATPKKGAATRRRAARAPQKG